MAWAQAEVEINGVNKNCMPQTRLARKQQLRGTGCRAGCEVIPLCNTTSATVQLKKSMDVIRARRSTEVTARQRIETLETAASAVSPEPALSEHPRADGAKPGDSATKAESPFNARADPLNRDSARLALTVCQTPSEVR
jgi:hypothetical protein